MIEEKDVKNYEPMIELGEQSFFKLECLIKAAEIQQSAHCECKEKLFLAFSSGNADIILYFKRHSAYVPIIKRIPWFQGSHKQISAFCFDPLGIWLLSVSVDGSLYIIPALSLIDERYVTDKKWTTDDITSFPPTSSQSSYSRPTTVIWWQDVKTSTDLAIIGTEYGEIIFINLETGQQVGVTHVNGNIANLQICHDERDSSVFLLITNQTKQQWRLLLGQYVKNSRHAMSRNSKLNSALNSSLMTPDPITEDSFLMSHYNRKGQQLYTHYHYNTNHISIHGPDCSLLVHKLFESCRNIVLTERFFFITDTSQRTLYAISDRLSEIHVTEDFIFNPECIIGCFSFEDTREVIRTVYRVTDFRGEATKQVIKKLGNKYNLSKKLKDAALDTPYVDTCIIVTNCSVYKVVLRTSLLSVFMDLVLTKNELKKAMKLATVFGLNTQQLLEYAGDILLENKEHYRALICYKSAECKLLKGMLKFASEGHTQELISCLTASLVSPTISELAISTRIHLSNLCILVFVELTLRTFIRQNKAIYKKFLHFLSTNTFYEELFTINIIGQTCLWEVLHHLATQRGLYGPMLDVLMRTVKSFSTNNQALQPIPYGLLMCLTEPNLMQAMLLNPDLARSHLQFMLENLPNSQIFVLQRLVTLYDPTNPVLRPKLVRCRARQRTTSHSSQSSQCDSIDLADNSDEADALIREIIETVLLVLLTLIYQKSLNQQDTVFTFNMQLLELKKDPPCAVSNVDFKRRPLSAGFAHVALIRNGNVYTWGNSVQGCLGTGSSVLRYDSPRPIPFFQAMEIEVLSVSCGHCHTLAVTNNGVYTWGASQFGQLGLGNVVQCSTPELITSLAQEIIVDAVAGQYHSVALTVDGRVFTWGWGVHGQLGHGNTDKKNIPTLVISLLGIVVCQISAGHAHTLALSTEGVVYAFGCNVYGQLGVGTNVKSTIPMKILLSEKICLITTGYFCNLAVSHTNKLYVWGASPRVLRLQAHEQKKIQLEQRNATDKKIENLEDFEKPSDLDSPIDVNDVKGQTLENDAQNKYAQTKVIISNTKTQKRSDGTSMKNINVGLLEEAQTHLTPTLVDTSLVKGQITQISSGCHHNALITKDGSLYTWGRSLDGQLGHGSMQREITIPTPLCYNPASIFAHVPPRPNAQKKLNKTQQSDTVSSDVENEKNDNMTKAKENKSNNNDSDIKEKVNPIIKTVGVCCGYDYTIAIQPGGTFLAWGNNSKAQLGRPPAKDAQDSEEKPILLKVSKRIIRHLLTLDVPSQVPNIPAPIISYRSYDVPSLAGLIPPLSVIEKSPGELTLHYVLEHFHGLYDPTKIMEKCIELKNYQACSKVAFLQHNIIDAFVYQLKVLDELSIRSPIESFTKMNQRRCLESDLKSVADDLVNDKASSLTYQFKKNTELFNRQVEKNLIESVEDYVVRSRVKIPASKSLNNLQTIEQELYNFDCQGGSEQLCKDSKCEEISVDMTDDVLDFDNVEDEEWIENLTLENDTPPEQKISTESCKKDRVISPHLTKETMNDTNDDKYFNQHQIYRNNMKSYENNILHSQKNNFTNETIKVIKFYLNEIEHETDMVKCNILQKTIDFWISHNLSIPSLENVFREHIDTIFYQLGLLLFCEKAMEKYLGINKGDMQNRNFCIINLFSLKFCLQVCSMLLHHIDQDQPIPEYIKLLSSLMADHYGPPLTGYPGSSGNNTSEQMMEGIISTLSSDNCDSRSFVHIKEPDTVYRFLASEEDTMVFTCGHHFPTSVYETEVLPGMETELLTPQSLVLPCTAQFLGQMLSQTNKPEIVCPLCIPHALGAMIKEK